MTLVRMPLLDLKAGPATRPLGLQVRGRRWEGLRPDAALLYRQRFDGEHTWRFRKQGLSITPFLTPPQAEREERGWRWPMPNSGWPAGTCPAGAPPGRSLCRSGLWGRGMYSGAGVDFSPVWRCNPDRSNGAENPLAGAKDGTGSTGSAIKWCVRAQIRADFALLRLGWSLVKALKPAPLGYRYGLLLPFCQKSNS